MKLRFAVAVFAGCASGGSAGGLPIDGNGPPQQDAKVFEDGRAQLPLDAAIDAPRVIPPDARMIDAHPDACVPVATELLANPALDLSPQGTSWVEEPIDSSNPLITTDPSGFAGQSAPYKAFLGGYEAQTFGLSSVTDQMYQDVAVPAGTTELVLTGYFVVATTETTTTTAYDTGSVDLIQTNGTPIENVMSLSNLTTTPAAWQAFTYTFAHPSAGQTVRLRLTSTNDVTNNSNFFFDTLSLKATHCH